MRLTFVAILLLCPIFAAAQDLSAPNCGLHNDTTNHVPDATAWTNFTPPAVGKSYTDAEYGCAVKRLTNGVVGGVALHHYYSTIEPMSAGDTKIWIFPESGASYIIDLNGNVVVPAGNMPSRNGNQIFWDRTDDRVFWQTSGNVLQKCTVNSFAHTVGCVPNHIFKEYAGHGLNSPDASSMTPNGWLYFVGQNVSGGPMDIFMFNPTTGVKSPVHTTNCTGDVMSIQPGCIHKMITTADGGVISHVTGNVGENGGYAWGPETRPAWTWTMISKNLAHWDSGKDLSGTPVLLEEVDNDDHKHSCPSRFGTAIKKSLQGIPGIGTVSCLFETVPPMPVGWHVSYRDWPTRTWAVYSAQNSSPAECFNNAACFAAPSSRNWLTYANEILLVRVDNNNGSTNLYRLALSHSRERDAGSGYFWDEPRAAISFDGKYVIFDSNAAWGATGCGSVSNCTDIYLIGPLFGPRR